MSYDYSGYPAVECPTCGSPTADVIQPMNPERQFGPGEEAIYLCDFCGRSFHAFVPEPPDTYEGDGVFAENH